MNLPTLDNNSPSARPTVCRFLRTKTAFGAYMSDIDEETGEDAASWQDGTSTTAVFWCLKTMDTCGPDDDFAHARTCRPGRECFRGHDE